MSLASVRAIAYTGPRGANGADVVESRGDNLLTLRATRPLGPREGLTIAVAWPPGVVGRPSAFREATWFAADNWPLGLPLLAVLGAFLAWRTYGVDPGVGRSVRPEYAPPSDLSPAEAGTLVDERVERRDVVATLVDLAVRGYLRVEQVSTAFDETDYAFRRLKRVLGDPDIRLLSAIAVWRTRLGHGPFVMTNLNDSLIALQVFMGTISIAVMSLACVVRERQRAPAELLRSHDDLEQRIAERTAALSTAVELLLFDTPGDRRPSRVIPLDPRRNRTYYYWHALVPGIGAGQLYGFRVHGPHDPARGLRFDGSKVLLDPYTRAVVVGPHSAREAALHRGDNCAQSLRSVVFDPRGYDWEGDMPLRRPFSGTVIYELHVGGFTRHPSSGVGPPRRGTYAGLIEKIPYLRSLGITAVELLPVLQFDEQDVAPPLSNY